MKTIEFKIRPNRATKQRIDAWLTDLRKVWNMGLELLEESQQWYWREKNNAVFEDDYYPVPWEWHGNQDRGWGLACSITAPHSRRYSKVDQLHSSPDRDYRLCCPIKRSPSNQPPTYIVKGKNPWQSLGRHFSVKNHLDKAWLTSIPQVFIRGTLHSLARAWDEYCKGNQKRPRFKSSNKAIKTLACFDCLKSVTVKGGVLKLPKISPFIVKTLNERWNPDIKICTAKLCKRPSGYYVQLTGEVPSKFTKPSARACGIDVGLQYIIADDADNVVEPPKYLRKTEKRLKRLQRKASRQYRMNKRSKNWEKTQKLVARQHEKIASQRRLFNHKISTYRVRTYAAIAVEEIKIENLVRRPKPVETEEGSGVWQKNRAAQKSGLNKSFTDAGLGQLLTMIETKCKASGRLFERVPPQYTSQDCPECGYRQKKSLSQRTHQCQQCGYTAKRDVAAAINIFAKSSFAEIYPRSVRESQACGSTISRDEAGTVAKPTSGSLPDTITQLCLFEFSSTSTRDLRKKVLRQKPRKCLGWEQLQLFSESG
jgi:putative transposase